jgi:glycosyltransferase involved in cell wall biosynthesis
MTSVYYITRYLIMAMTAVAFALTFSLTRSLSARFVRLLILTILCMVIVRMIIPMYMSDITQLVVALITVIIGMNLTWDENDWANISYYYTVLLIGVSISNSLFYAGGLYVPEHYMFDEGKNQLGAMMAIGATACFYFGMKRKEERTAYWVATFLTLICLVLIRSRADCFALIAMMLLITAKDADFHIKWNVKTVLTIIGILLIGYIIYVGFISDELNTFMHGGKSSTGINDLTTRRWDRNQKGFELLRHHQTIQEMQTPMKIPFIHNYPLLRLVRYRLFSLPLLLFYIYFGVSTLIEVFKSRKSDIRQVGWIVCCVPMLISFAEPNFPYGPGLVQMLAFLLLGFSLRPAEPQGRPEAENANTVLHVCNDFYYSKVHSNLYRELDQAGVEQIVFSPVRKETPENHLFEGQHTTFHYAHILNRFHRLFFFHKIDRIVREIEKTVDLNNISCCHATTLFSDGMVAMELYRKYGIPYVVAVRNCDVNAFLRYMPHLWWVHRAVIESADKVIFIAPALRQRLLKHPTLIGMQKMTEEKSMVISNGINEFWLNNLHTEKNPETYHNLMYAGIFNRNKNLPRLIHTLQSLRTEFPDLHFDVAGDGGDNEKQVIHLMRQHSDWITYHGKITDLEEMEKLYRSNGIFVMPSKSETFGLVYLEALSQGLSILWSRGEAIDGLFTEHIGESVNPLNNHDLAEKLRLLLNQSENYETLPDSIFESFRWSSIARQYLSIYPIQTRPCNRVTI